MDTRLDTNDRLDELKLRYADAFRAIEEEGLTLSRLQIQDGKMMIQGTADSLDAKDRVVNRLLAVDPNWENQVVLDIRTEEQQPHLPNTGQTTVNTAEEFTHGSGSPAKNPNG